jgi:serine/threonine-protein kinase
MDDTVTPERWRQLVSLYEGALARPPEDREAFLATVCADPSLRSEVQALLAESVPTSAIAAQTALAMLGRLIGLAVSPSIDREADPASTSASTGSEPAVDEARFAPGVILASRYRIVNLLGRGAMGEVYRAEDLKLGQPVALKLLSTRGLGRDQSIERLAGEVRLARRIAHPNVCRVYDIGEVSGWHYLSMEYVDGETLASLLKRIGRLPMEKALDVARQLCAGLAAAHECGVLHRDLKPANIMVDGRGDIRIMDFGISVETQQVQRVELAGTPAYMAPEQLRGEALTERADLYALGLVFYELFSGRRLYASRTIGERQWSHDGPTLEFGPDLDIRVVHAIRACLAADPKSRPGSVLAVAAALPGGDSLVAALAHGRLLSPTAVATVDVARLLPRAVAWVLLLLTVSVLAGIAARGDLLSVSPVQLPKPPEVLAERARTLLAAAAGGAVAPADGSAYWFDAATDRGGRHVIRYFYRQARGTLVSDNIFHTITESDPPMTAPGMGSVVLDPSGRLIALARIDDAVPNAVSAAAHDTWTPLFVEAGLDIRQFTATETQRVPIVAQDSVRAWIRSDGGGDATHVTAASLAGRPVYFRVEDSGPLVFASPVPSTRRDPLGEAVLWGFFVFGFALSAVFARRNVRGGRSDRAGARKIFVLVAVGGTLSALLRAHHVPNAIEELRLLVGVVGWSLVVGAFSWLAYLSLEPAIRRWRPTALVSWTRVMTARFSDPLVGRDVLIGACAGVCMVVPWASQTYVTGGPTPGELVSRALDSLQSGRVQAALVIISMIEGVQYSLGGLALITLVKRFVKRTWLTIVLVMIAAAPLAPTESRPDTLLFAVAGGAIALAVQLQVGLLASVVAMTCARLLAFSPLTLQPGAWYLGSSLLVLLLIVAVAGYGFMVALAGRGAFDGGRRGDADVSV